jgi:hypothetical protein
VGGQPEHDAATYGLFELRLILLREGSAFVRVRSRSLRGEKGLRIEFLSERRRTAANARQPCHSEGRGFESHHPLQESPRERGLFRWHARHGQQLGGVSPLWRLMAPTTSQRQLLRREAGWGGSPRRTRDSTNRNRIEGGAARASRPSTAKPDVIKGPQRRCGGCARKVAGLIRGGLRGRREMPGRHDRRVVATGRAERRGRAAEKSAEAVVPAGIAGVAGKGRTQSRAAGRPSSWESH